MDSKVLPFFVRLGALLLLLSWVSACAPAVKGPPPAKRPGISQGKGTSGGAPRVNSRREALLRELARLRSQREHTQTTFLGVRVPKITLSFSQIAKGLQRADDPVDKPTRAEPELNFPTLPDEPEEQEVTQGGEAILDERTLMLLAEAERMQSNLTEPLLSDLARGSLSSEAFDQWSKELTLERRYRNLIIAIVVVCSLVLAVSGYYLFNFVLEELRVSRLPTFGRK